MQRLRTVFAPLLSCALALSLSAYANDAPAAPAGVDIAYTRTQLDNGLTLIVHTDRKAPIAHVAVWYHVGSKDEPKGRSGFAHLYEHLMFEGTHLVPDFDKPLEEVGASNNGTTDFDRTNFYVNLPVTALDRVLWIEADRMRTLLDGMDQDKLDTQRGVVQNEKRQGENEPYGLVWERLFEALYPVGHPYRWLPIGSMEDLNAATLDDVKSWYRDYYGAANAVLIVAGDVDAAAVAATVKRYFGDLPAGPPLKRVQRWIAPRTEPTREDMFDRVAQPRLYQAYTVPGFGEPDNDTLGVFAYLLGGGKTSRLYERLVFREQLVDSVSASVNSGEIGGQLIISADIKRDVALAKVEAAIAEELTRLREEGPSKDELTRAKTAFRAAIVRGLERVQGKATVLAECQLYVDDPACYRASFAHLEALDVATLRRVAQRWLRRGEHVLTVLPQPPFESAKDNDSGEQLPRVDTFPDARIPALERAQLSNGIDVVLARRHEIPVVNMALQFDAGYAADVGVGPGTASFTLSLLDEGAGDYDALGLAAAAEGLGAEIGSGSSLDTSSVSLSALREQLDASMALFADVVQRPRFATDDIERVRKQWLARIEQEKTEPVRMAMRLLPAQLYGAGHAYANPFSGSGSSTAIAALTREDLLAFHRRWLRPDRATLMVVGDTTLDAFLPLAEKHFGRWHASSEPAPSKQIADVAPPTAPRVFLVDKPGAIQSVILAGLVTPSSKAANVLEIDTMNTVLGGLFTARLNANLRETKHWAYGAYSFFTAAAGQRPWMMYAPVQIDKTAEAATELRRELTEYVDSNPATDEEILRARQNDVRSLPGQFESAAAVLGALADIVRFGRPDDYVATLKQRLDAQTDAGIRAAARAVLQPQALTWVIVGDLSKIEAPVRALELGTVQVVDADGQPISR